jgi:hypothetical protein
MSMGHKDGYLNAIAFETFRLFASLAEWLGEDERAAVCRADAERIAVEYNRQLWNEDGGRYVGWIDVEGKSHDFWFTFTNFLAVGAGIVPKDRLERMMTSFRSHTNHHRIFAGGMNLDPVTDGSYRVGGEFGLWLNGGVLLGPAAFELYARALHGGETAWEMLDDLVAQWEKDSLSHTPLFDWCRPEQFAGNENPRLTYTGGNAYTWIDGVGARPAGTESYLSDGGAMLWALYCGVLGLRCDFQRLTIEPHVPRALADADVSIRMMGRQFRVRYQGHGDALAGLRHNGTPIRGNSLLWSEIKDGDVFDCECSPEEDESTRTGQDV